MPAKKKPSPAKRARKATPRAKRASAPHFVAPPPPVEYAPSSAGLLLARLYDGKARDVWPSDVVSDEALARARDLLMVLHYAFHNAVATAGLERISAMAANRLDQVCADRRSRIAAATNILRGVPSSEGERLLQYSEHIARLVAAAREADALHRSASAELSVFALAEGFDQRFASLSPARVRKTLLSVVSGTKGGSTNVGADHVAAELAVVVGAFGAAKTGDFDRDVAAFKGRLRTERNRRNPSHGV